MSIESEMPGVMEPTKTVCEAAGAPGAPPTPAPPPRGPRGARLGLLAGGLPNMARGSLCEGGWLVGWTRRSGRNDGQRVETSSPSVARRTEKREPKSSNPHNSPLLPTIHFFNMARASTSQQQASSSSSPAPAPAPKRKSKIFSESQGLSHLLALATSAGASQEDKDRRRTQHSREVVQRKKEQRKAAAKEKEAKNDNKAKARDVMGVPASRSKSVIRAELKAKLREKAKQRKKERKGRLREEGVVAAVGESPQATGDAGEEDTQTPRQPVKKLAPALSSSKGAAKKKRVSFA